MSFFMNLRRRCPIGIGTPYSNKPPEDQPHLVWMWDPDLAGGAQSVVGPAGTVTGAVQTIGNRSYYTFAPTDKIDFGDSLDAVWNSGSGFTLYATILPQASDISFSPWETIIEKAGDFSTLAEWTLRFEGNGFPVFTFVVWYGGGSTNFESYSSTGSFIVSAGTPYVLACTFDPTQVVGSRTKLYINGVIAAPNIGTSGTGTISDTTAPLRIGASGASGQGVTRIGAAYAYSTVHTANQVASNYGWVHRSKGW
jgi:hypothetical protein